VLMIVEFRDIKNQILKLVNFVILVVDVVMDQILTTVPAVTKEHISVTMEFVDHAQKLGMEMMKIGHVNHVTDHVALVTDQKLPIVLIVAMNTLIFT